MYGEQIMGLGKERLGPMRKQVSGFFKTSNVSRKERVNGTRQRTSLIERVRRVSFPVYGPEDQALGLTVCGFSTRGFADEPAVSIGFTFAKLSQKSLRETFQIETSVVGEPNVSYPAPGEAVTPRFNLHHWLFEQYHLKNEMVQFVDAFSRWEGKIIVSGESFSGEIYSWVQPYQLAFFLLADEYTHLIGNTFGLSLDQLREQLQHLTRLNQREDLLIRYQREFDEEKQWLLEQS
jgi:hypothetical protein